MKIEVQAAKYRKEVLKKLLNKEDVECVNNEQVKIDKITQTIFNKMTYDDTGRYSDDGGKHYNTFGYDKLDQLLKAENMIKDAMEIIKEL